MWNRILLMSLVFVCVHSLHADFTIGVIPDTQNMSEDNENAKKIAANN